MRIDPRGLAGTALLASCWGDELADCTDRCHALEDLGTSMWCTCIWVWSSYDLALSCASI